MYQNIAGLQLKNCMYSIYQAGRYDDLYCLNEKKTKEWNFTNQNTLFGDPLKTQIVVCQVWKIDSWDVGWDDCLRWKRKVRVWAQKQKKEDIVWHAILSGQPNLQPFCAGQQKCVSTTWHA
jgi:hypothetical protein